MSPPPNQAFWVISSIVKMLTSMSRILDIYLQHTPMGCRILENFSEKNCNHLQSFHHSATRKMFGLKWKHKWKNSKSWMNILKLTLTASLPLMPLLQKIIWNYIGNTYESLLKAQLGAWIKAPRQPQSSCRNSFIKVLQTVLLNTIISVDTSCKEKQRSGKLWSKLTLTLSGQN